MEKEKQLILNGLIMIIWLTGAECFIGINWGRQATHRLIPSMVVDLLLQNDIHDLKLFSPSDNVLKAFAGGEVAITTTMPNEVLETMTTAGIVGFWLQQRLGNYPKVNIKYLHVGQEPFTPNSRNETYNNVVEVLRIVQAVLYQKFGDKIKATTPHFTDVLKPNITKPSEADFRPDLKQKMVDFVMLLNQTGSPFVANMFPIHFSAINGWDMEFSFIDNHSNFSIRDGNLTYRNTFEFVYDSFLWAIRKAGAPDLDLQVGRVGWPTDGYPGANIGNAERFFKSFLPYIRSNRGTPMRPGISIDVFIHSLVDENKNKIVFGAFERHWGVYRSDGQPKYKIDFTAQGRDIYPTTAKGVVRMPKRWCVFNGNMDNVTLMKQEFDFACQQADCTTLYPGGSCSHLNFAQNVSYAFNRYFQSKTQANDDRGVSCDFSGMGMVVPDDPSVGTCKFPVEVLAAENVDTGGLVADTGERSHGLSRSTLVLSLLLIYLV